MLDRMGCTTSCQTMQELFTTKVWSDFHPYSNQKQTYESDFRIRRASIPRSQSNAYRRVLGSNFNRFGTVSEPLKRECIMKGIFGSVVDIEPRQGALDILENCVSRMRLWEAPYDLDAHFVKDIDVLINHAELDDNLDNKIYIMAQCIRIVTDIIDRIEHGEEDEI